MSHQNYDVVIVGAGIGGAIMALELGKLGRRILVLEAGPDLGHQKAADTFFQSTEKTPESPYPPRVDANPGQEVSPRPTTHATFPENLSEGYPENLHGGGYIYDSEKSYLLQKGPLPFLSTSERILGGTTQHWLGTSVRFLENDFLMASRYGVAKDWPIGAQELAEDYARVEEEVGVASDAEEQRQDLGPMGIRYTPGYQYPLPPIASTLVDQSVADAVDGRSFDGFQGLAAKVTRTPAGRNSEPYAHKPVCIGNTNCIPLCPIQAKYDARRTLGKAQQNGVTVNTQCVVHRVLVGENGRVTGVEYTTWANDNGESKRTGTQTVHAHYVVLAAHAIETPRLLLMSRDENRGALAEGVANSSGLVGKNLMDHPIYLTWALSPEPIWGYRGPLSTSGIETLRDGPFRSERAAWRVEIGNEGWNFPANDPWTTTLDLIDGTNNGQLNPKGKRHFGDALVAELNGRLTRQWRLAFLMDQSPDPNNRVALDERIRDGLGFPRPVVHYDLSDYTKLGFVHAEIFARHVYRATGSKSYVRNPGTVRNREGREVPNPSFFSMKPEWRRYFKALPDELMTQDITNLEDPKAEGIPEGFRYFGAGHIMGTCTMGSSRSSSVVDKDLRSWDHDNLFIVGSSTFPTAATANPTMTLAALAYRAARAIAKDLSSGGVG